jgi:hypothetical protein
MRYRDVVGRAKSQSLNDTFPESVSYSVWNYNLFVFYRSMGDISDSIGRPTENGQVPHVSMFKLLFSFAKRSMSRKSLTGNCSAGWRLVD